jgi:hypothetical protein
MTLTEGNLLYRADESEWGYIHGGTLFYYNSSNSSKPIKDAFEAWLNLNYNNGQPIKSITGVSASVLTVTAHKMNTGDRVVFGQAAAELNLSSGDHYFVRFVGADTIKLYPTKADAIDDTNMVTVTGTPAGTAELQLSQDGALNLNVASADAAMISDYLLENVPTLLGRLQPIDNAVWDGLQKTLVVP